MTVLHRILLIAAPLLLCTLASAPLQAQAATKGSGHAASETRVLAEFQAIALSGDMDLVVRQGTPQAVQVQADDNLLPLLETSVENSVNGTTLQVRWKRGESIYGRSKVLVTVVVPTLSALVASGSGDRKVESFTTPALKVSLSGSGDARLNGLATDDLGIRISGSGNVSGSGKAAKMKVSIAGYQFPTEYFHHWWRVWCGARGDTTGHCAWT